MRNEHNKFTISIHRRLRNCNDENKEIKNLIPIPAIQKFPTLIRDRSKSPMKPVLLLIDKSLKLHPLYLIKDFFLKYDKLISVFKTLHIGI